MAAVTPLLGLVTPTQGTLSGTWGDTVNYGISEYVDIAIAGTLSFAGDGAITLANTTGSSSGTAITTTTAQYMVIRITGTQTVTKVITGPSYSKLYMVDHAGATSAVTFKASGQTGVSIAVGEKAFVYYNGTDYVKVATSTGTGSVTSVAGTGTVNGLTLTGTVTTSGSLTLGGTLSGTASININGTVGATTASTGAFTTTTVSTSETLSYGTANGVTYLNGSKVLTSGSALVFDGTNLGVGVTPSAWNTGGSAFEVRNAGNGLFCSGANTLYMLSNAFLNSAGDFKYVASAAATRYQHQAGEHRWYNAASGTAGNTISFTQAMTLDASGNLGIGTSSPAYKLDVQTAAGRFQVRDSGGSSVKLMNATTGGNMAIDSVGGILQILSNGTEISRFSTAGGFSVGTTADPGAGAIYATGNITAYYSDARLKTVSGKIENALDKVAQLSGVYYTNNSVAKSFGYDSDEVQVGVLAQDVEAVMPEIVKAAPFDLDENNNSKSGENYKTVQYEKLIPLLIEAINELRAEVKALKGA